MSHPLRVIFIGASRAGKTTLCQALRHEELRYHKTQTISVVGGFIIDTPGEYLERGRMRGALSVAAADAQLVVFLLAAKAAQSFFSPGLASMFNKPCVGVITKADIASAADIEKARVELERAGAERVFVTSSRTGEGIQAFADYLAQFDKEGAKRWEEK